eukprot:SAG25_NODE_4879_length_737_cov_1.141066_1_plen_55_part_10
MRLSANLKKLCAANPPLTACDACLRCHLTLSYTPPVGPGRQNARSELEYLSAARE